MASVADLIEQIKVARKLNSDAAFARLVHVTPASVSNWKHSRNYPDTVQCARIAELSGEPLARVLGIVGEARANSTEEKRVWRRLATAAALALAFWLPALPAPAKVYEVKNVAEQSTDIGIMRSEKAPLLPGPHPSGAFSSRR